MLNGTPPFVPALSMATFALQHGAVVTEAMSLKDLLFGPLQEIFADA